METAANGNKWTSGDMSERRILRDVKWSSYEPGRNEHRRLTGTRYVGNAITNAARSSRFREGADGAAEESETRLDTRQEGEEAKGKW